MMAVPATDAPPRRAALGWLVASNALTLAIALAQGWSLAVLMWPYWFQSVAIGYFNYRRILGLREFSTEGFQINRRAVEPTEDTKRKTARFFALHYGAFHLAYAVVLLRQHLTPFEWLGVLAAAVAFIDNHRRSHRRFLEADRAGRPNIGLLMFLPYLRVLPMHLTVILGAGTVGSGAYALLLFGALKTAADCAMHVAEHRMLARSAART